MHLAIRSGLKVVRNGTSVALQRGDEVPEASTWRNLPFYIRTMQVTDKDGCIIRNGVSMGKLVDIIAKEEKKAAARRAPEPAPAPVPESLPVEKSETPVSRITHTRSGLAQLRKMELLDMANDKGLDCSEDFTKEMLINAIMGE